MRLRATTTNVNGLIQQLRMQAVRGNQAVSIRTAIVNAQPTLYIDTDGNQNYTAGEPSVPIARDTVLSDGTGGPAVAPPATPTTQITIPPYINFATTPILSFNVRGLPCSDPPVCNTLSPYVVYLRQTRTLAVPGWAALTISKAGRVKAYTFGGGATGTWQ
jgi:hypothetical protein